MNFARAAAELGVTPTAVSRTIKAMEAQLNVRLFNRTTRSVSLTEAGSSLNSTVRVNSSYVAYRMLIEPYIEAFLASFPLIHVEISLDNVLGDIVNAGFDIGIRMGKRVQNDMVARQLGSVQHSGMDDAFHLYYPHRKHMPRKLRAFVDFMLNANAA
ncbi:LysR family transcriptional regulator [Rhizobium leguminosarum]|uniref:LysR family transcriptional regulator n=1 Tax=Rhizobium leguminosarum TaxID=384 RepID=UPI001FEEFA46|nr:LysR family transcriptional regulator [Rhizobium leguminosarum]